MYTSDLRGAGTDANVEIELWGTKVKSEPFDLMSWRK